MLNCTIVLTLLVRVRTMHTVCTRGQTQKNAEFYADFKFVDAYLKNQCP
jgi:hypothetical protein